MAQFIKGAKKINVVLIREKLSKLSENVQFKQSIIMTLAHTEAATPQFKDSKPREVSIELKKQMDPASLAEQAVGLNLKLMKKIIFSIVRKTIKR